jgi:hypothetical protein
MVLPFAGSRHTVDKRERQRLRFKEILEAGALYCGSINTAQRKGRVGT